MDLDGAFTGTILGLAIGDALGHPTEFLTLEQIRQRYGFAGVTDFEPSPGHPAGTYTDDTQMSIAVAEALIEAGDQPLGVLMKSMARRFVEWADSPDNNRAAGRACMTGCANLRRGLDWRTAGVAWSKGCGSAMRVAPVGLYYHRDLNLMLEVACASSLPTHRHPTGVAAAAGAAAAVALLLRGTTPGALVPALLDLTRHLDAGYATKVAQVGDVLDREPDDAMATLGEGWVGEEAVADALYCFLRAPRDYERTVLTAANSQGDSDSIACIAGAMSGAYNGIEAIPQHWRRNVENAAYLRNLGARLFERAD
jgi:ADP-ribosylglycohydrolase